MTPSVSARKFSVKNGGVHFPRVFSVQTTHFHLVISKIRFEIFRNGNVSFGPIEYREKGTLRFGPEIFRPETEGVIFPAFYRSKPPMAAPGLLGPGTARRVGHITMVILTSVRKVGTPSRNPHVSWLRTKVFLEGLGGEWLRSCAKTRYFGDPGSPVPRVFATSPRRTARILDDARRKAPGRVV